MLGLGSSVNNEEGYAKGERYRERYHTGGTYNETTNPIGREGKEEDWIGEFTLGGDSSSFTFVNASEMSFVGEFKLRTGATDGHAWNTFSVVPYTSYTLTCTYDKTTNANGTGRVDIGTSAGDDSIIASSELAMYTSGSGTDVSLTFNSANNNYLYLNLVGTTAGKFSYFDDISLKES